MSAQAIDGIGRRGLSHPRNHRPPHESDRHPGSVDGCAAALGVDAINHQLTSAALAFKPRLLNACGLMPGCRTAEAWFMKDEPWVESLPKPDDADQAIR